MVNQWSTTIRNHQISPVVTHVVKGVNRQRDMDLVNNDSMLQNNQDRTHNPKTVGSSPTRATNKFMGLD